MICGPIISQWWPIEFMRIIVNAVGHEDNIKAMVNHRSVCWWDVYTGAITSAVMLQSMAEGYYDDDGYCSRRWWYF